MRSSALLSAVCLILATMACDESGPYTPRGPVTTRVPLWETGIISVYVHWNDEGLAGKRVEVLELSREKFTNDDGIATFRVPAGEYTVRVYEINHGGPALLYVDTKVAIDPGEQATVDVVDCLPCV